MSSANLLARCGEEYLIQVRDVTSTSAMPGRFPYIFPGACSLYGGGIEEGETPAEAFQRELQEELPGLVLPEILAHREYHWECQLDEILAGIDNAFCGNAASFLGFQLDEKMPSAALGEHRGRNWTYRDFFLHNGEDHFFVAELDAQQRSTIQPAESQLHAWVSHYLARSLVMVPMDKVALLDDIALRIRSGEINLF